MMDEFKNTYFEECEDRLLEAEEGLSAMLEGARDSETINQVFRGIHSIKGGAGAFGFARLVSFTHEFETALDLVRDEKLSPDRDMCTLFLRALDIVSAIIDSEKEGASIESDFGSDIAAELSEIVGSGENASKANANHLANEEVDSEQIYTWSIIFRPEPHMLATGNDPIFILSALCDLGDATITPELDDLPSLQNLNVDECHTNWRIILKTAAPENEIREAFDFVEGLCELHFERQNVPPNDLPERRKPVCEALHRQERRKEDRELKEIAASPNSGVSTANAAGVPSAASIRVDLLRIDQLVNLVGEMVIAQSMLQEQVRWLPEDTEERIGHEIANLSRHMRDLQESVMAVRAQPIKSVFTRMPRIIREVASACDKDVRFVTFGEDTEVDKTVLERLIDPLTHMIRNSIDHGIEKPKDRQAKGKPAYGTIELSARHKSGRIIIELKDDGQGINRDAVINKAIKQGLVAEGATLSPAEIDNLIFKAGFSTAETLSAVSGRGVGMDVVKRNISELNGRISVTSTPDKGCVMTLSLPLTLAVMDGMVVSVGAQRFVLPTVNIVESFRPRAGDINKLSDNINVIKARSEYVRIIPLYKMFNITEAIHAPDDALMILLESDEGGRIAVMVDDVLGQQQVVIKSLEHNFAHVDGISAATILGNGDVALILDVPGLSDMPPQALGQGVGLPLINEEMAKLLQSPNKDSASQPQLH